uniref:Reverse transcriptase domain-containing protein n=1 Tax=Anopheles stephensi TaxID=30069 RepID=A0A182YEZ3_ANOST
MGFNPWLVDLSRRFGEQSSFRILINGSLSPSFPIRRSVRQADPLSMHLFILYLQPLITRIEGICCDRDDLVRMLTTSLSLTKRLENHRDRCWIHNTNYEFKSPMASDGREALTSRNFVLEQHPRSHEPKLGLVDPPFSLFGVA